LETFNRKMKKAWKTLEDWEAISNDVRILWPTQMRRINTEMLHFEIKITKIPQEGYSIPTANPKFRFAHAVPW